MGANDWIARVCVKIVEILRHLEKAHYIEDVDITYKLGSSEPRSDGGKKALEAVENAVAEVTRAVGRQPQDGGDEKENAPSHECEVCKRRFRTRARFETHRKRVHCKKRVPKETRARGNLSSVSRRKSGHSCKVCRKHFSSERLVQSHYNTVHSKPPEAEEVEDGELQIAEGGDEEDIIAAGTAALPFYCCSLCYRSYRFFEELRAHKCPESRDSSKPPQPITDLSFLDGHNRFHCGLCLEELRQFRRIKYHVEKCRGGNIKCELCGLERPDRKSMNAHKASRHRGEFAFRCHECPKRFQLNTSLQKHMANSHERERQTHRCGKCGKRFIKKVYLTNHQTRFHNLFKPFLCQTCGDRFVSEASLSNHMEIHTGVKRFQCEFCDKKFRRKDKLEFHLSVHTGERPHKCPRCAKAFVTKTKLQDHVRRHMGEKRFACLICNKKYSGPMDLRNHLARVHPSVGRNIKPNQPLTPQIIANINLSASLPEDNGNPVLGASVVVDQVPPPPQPEVVEDAFPSLDIDELNEATAEINIMEYDPSMVTDAILLDEECFQNA